MKGRILRPYSFGWVYMLRCGRYLGTLALFRGNELLIHFPGFNESGFVLAWTRLDMND